MLQSIRSVTQSKVGSYVVRGLFVILIGAFGIWGVGDFIRARPQDDSIIEVGDHKIGAEELLKGVRAEIDSMGRRGLPATMEMAKRLGVVERVVDNKVAQALLDQFGRDQHVVVGPGQLRVLVEGEPAFLDDAGKFDPAVARRLLQQRGMTEASYAALLAEGMPRQMAAGPLVAGTPTPDALVDLVYGIHNERRVAETVAFPAAAIKDPGTPDEAAVKAYYDGHKADFTAPEYRGFTLLVLRAGDVQGVPEPAEDQVNEYYAENQERFAQPEQRHVLQLTLPDEATAAKAAAELDAGKGFEDVGKRIAHQDKDAIDLGLVSKKALPPDTAALIFGLKDGETTKPTKTAFGFAIYRIVEIKPPSVEPLDQAKPQIVTALKAEAAGELLFKLRTSIEDALAGGAKIDAIADQFKLKPIAVAAADRAGLAPDGKKIADFGLPADQVLKTVFATSEGQVSPIQEPPGGAAYFVAAVTGVTPAALKPLDQVRDRAVEGWRAEARARLAKEKADALQKALDADHPLAQRAAEQKLDLKVSEPVLRSQSQAQNGLPDAVITRLFELKTGESAVVADANGAFVVRVKELKPADPKADQVGVEETKAKLAQSLTEDLLLQFEAALKARYPVRIDQAKLDRLFPAESN